MPSISTMMHETFEPLGPVKARQGPTLRPLTAFEKFERMPDRGEQIMTLKALANLGLPRFKVGDRVRHIAAESLGIMTIWGLLEHGAQLQCSDDVVFYIPAGALQLLKHVTKESAC